MPRDADGDPALVSDDGPEGFLEAPTQAAVGEHLTLFGPPDLERLGVVGEDAGEGEPPVPLTVIRPLHKFLH